MQAKLISLSQIDCTTKKMMTNEQVKETEYAAEEAAFLDFFPLFYISRGLGHSSISIHFRQRASYKVM